jgi:hypothetical protein
MFFEVTVVDKRLKEEKSKKDIFYKLPILRLWFLR